MYEMKLIEAYYKYRRMVNKLQAIVSKKTTRHYTKLKLQKRNPNQIIQNGRMYIKIYQKAN